MFRYVLVLLLINAYSRSLGVPIKENAPKISLSKSLTVLAQRCENPILAALITTKVVECDVLVPPYTQKQFECLMFIDINTQLCDAVTTSKLSVSDELKAKINESVKVDKFCTVASKWNITNLPGFPFYKSKAEKVFDNAISCSRVCGVEDIMSEDTNFYCKYYKWGTEVLNQQPTTVTQTSNIPAVSGSAENSDDIKIIPDSLNTVNSADALKNSQISKDTLIEPTEVKPALDVDLPLKPESTSLMSSTKDLPILPDNVEEQEKNIPSNTDSKVLKPEAVIAPSNSGPSNEAIDKPSAAEIQPVNIEDVGKIEKPEDVGKIEKPIHTSDRDAVLDKIKPQGEPDDYPDTEEGNEGLPDLKGGDESEDPVLGDLDTKQEVVQTNGDAKKINGPSTFNGEREFFPNTMQESFTDDDDHFFPFFLTAVILVVLLYVLYHNKNKVSKVFLGLIVEGRQPGRRRNSRGHAYRRLDTLEQAMSTNTAAPPSKIIY